MPREHTFRIEIRAAILAAAKQLPECIAHAEVPMSSRLGKIDYKKIVAKAFSN